MNFRFVTSVIAIQIVNYLFLVKYLARIVEFPYLFSLAIVTILLSFIWLLTRVKNEFLNLKTSLVLLTIFSSICFFLFYKIPVESLNVDRWSVISSFWKSSFQGKYPYFATSHMGNYPGPMPVYFLLFLPFHLLGEIGFSSLLAIWAMFLVFKKLNVTEKNIQIVLLLLLTSTPIWYEIVCRSTIFTNSFLVLLYFILTTSYVPNTSKKAVVIGIIGGILLSTRNIFGLSFVLMGFYFLFEKSIPFKSVLLWGIAVTITFGLTFFPFLLFYWDEFFTINPFIIQSTFLLPSYFIPVFGILALGLGFFCKQFRTTIFFNGLLLFAISSIYFIFHIAKSGMEEAYFGSIIDLTYFVFCLPFFYYTIATEN